MEPHLLAYAERHAPRYTSYPAAPHFSADIDGGVFRGWLEQLAPEAPVALYLHIPFCREICWYCGCHTFASRRDEPLNAYVDTLMREIDLVAGASGARSVKAIHWGGGTPNILGPAVFARIVQHLRFWFDLDAAAEHAIEIDARSLTAEQARQYAQSGVTRASLGVQDLNNHVQRAIGRIQPLSKVAEAASLLRGAGIEQLNFDLMYGLPHQSVEDVRHSVCMAVALRPSRLAIFGYAHVPWFKKRQRLIDEAALPDTALRFDQAAAAHEEAVAAGYVPIGIDHFALPDDPAAAAARQGDVKRSFQGYGLHQADALIGLGASAISTLPQGYAQNTTDVASWRRLIESDRLAVVRGHALSADDARRADVIQSLMCRLSADLGEDDTFAAELEALAPLARDGLAVIEGRRVTVPDAARPFARLVAQVFDAYGRDEAQRYSRAI